MGVSDALLTGGVSFFRTAAGLVQRPYETSRRIANAGKPEELVFIAGVCVLYFALASVVRIADFRPFLLTRQFLFLFAGAVSGALLAAGCLTFFGRLFGTRRRFLSVLVSWGYTMLPTVCWFTATSLLFLLLPPPRSTSPAGIGFSLLFLAASVAILWWKLTLSYLTIRFLFRVDLMRGIAIGLFCLPFFATWGVVMYKAGIFKVPFL